MFGRRFQVTQVPPFPELGVVGGETPLGRIPTTRHKKEPLLANVDGKAKPVSTSESEVASNKQLPRPIVRGGPAPFEVLAA